MVKEHTGSILMTGVPVARGQPVHIEHDDDTAFCDIDPKTKKIAAVHTPQDSFRRTHEMMHARHTDPRRVSRQYAGINQTVFDFVEDCRLHQKFWPWHASETPRFIRKETEAFMAHEDKTLAEHLAKNPDDRGTWFDFGFRLRRAAIVAGSLGNDDWHRALTTAGFATDTQMHLASQAMNLIMANREGAAARLLMSAFFPGLPDGGAGGKARDGRKVNPANGDRQPKMEIIELPLTEIIPEAKIGYRRATSGSRLHRPSLRKPVLPQKLFVRKAPREPGGTILVDASGSMGSWDQVKQWCEKAPFGTIAYYAGGSRNGKLFVYARNGKRARKIVDPHLGGNTVDGPAMTWLMSQAKPRLFVTDRGFCGAHDSLGQLARLEMLERAGEIIVKDYSSGS